MSIIRFTLCNSIVEANMVKHRLENEGIACYLTNDNFTTLLPAYNGMLGAGIQVMIDEKDIQKANELFHLEEHTEVIKCPNCQSEEVSFGLGTNRLKKVFFAFLSLWVGTPMGNIRNTYYCKRCQLDFNVDGKTVPSKRDE